MYLVENPVLQRELLGNLRMPRSFVLLLIYQSLLGLVVYFAWPQQQRLDLTESPEDARRLVDMFFLGQYLLACLMCPSFAAGTITGEKERKTYEMLLASPLRPSAIVLGKLIASLTHLAVLIFASLPIVVLCLPLGGVSVYEVLSAYLALIVSVLTFGMISIACSSYFQRTGASLAVSYLVILPLAMAAVLVWQALSDYGSLRVFLTLTLLPVIGIAISVSLFVNTSARLLHPPDVGAEGQDVVDLDQESQEAIGLVIQPDQFPDNLFAPAKRTTLMEDGVNPIYDKEIRSEIFSHGTLMLRVVIQVSILLALPVMGFCLFLQAHFTPWYIAYVLLFNMLVGPVFSAGSVTSERERQTLELLLTTIISPWEILTGKLIAGLRVSSVLTLFLVWPVVLAALFIGENHPYWTSFVAYLGIIMLTCVTTATVALFCSVLFHKTAHSLLAAYLMILVLFCLPPAVNFFATRFHPDAALTPYLTWVNIASPLATTFSLPLHTAAGQSLPTAPTIDPWAVLAGYGTLTLLLLGTLVITMIWLFHRRWRVVE